MNASVAQWLTELATDSEDAVERLVTGRVGVAVWSRASLSEIFLDVIETHRDQLDTGVVAWLNRHVQQVPPEGLSPTVWGVCLQDVFRAVTSLDLPQVAELLRTRARSLKAWLRPLVRDPSLDPQAAFLTALAWCNQNRHLAGFWRNLALRTGGETPEYTDIGLLGLRRMRDDEGQLPPKVPQLVLTTLLDLADVPGMEQSLWERTTRIVMAGYYLSPETWVREFAHIVSVQRASTQGVAWLHQILPLASQESSVRGQTRQGREDPPHTIPERDRIIAAVDAHGPATDELMGFLSRHRNYATRTNDPHYLVRTFNRLAEAAKEHDPEWAIAIIQEALDWDPSNARNWTVLARCHWARRDLAIHQHSTDRAIVAESEAFDALWEARRRFPYDAFIRNELAKFYKEAGDLMMAEELYSEAVADFPNNPVPRNGVADVKRLQGDLAGSETLYCATLSDFPSDPFAHNGLAELLFDRSAAAQDETAREQARELFQQAADLGDKYARDHVASFDQRWDRRCRQQPKHQPQLVSQAAAQLLNQDVGRMGAAQRLGRALLALWRANKESAAAAKSRLCDKAEEFLGMPDALTGECFETFIEARGMVLLARGKYPAARDYFTGQLESVAPRQPAGLLLGQSEARRRLGEVSGNDELLNRWQTRPNWYLVPLVLQVVRWCQSPGTNETLRAVLLQAFPHVRERLSAIQPETFEHDLSESAGQTAESPDKMLAAFLVKRVFSLASIETEDDLRDDAHLNDVRNALRLCEADLQSVVHMLVMAG
jgi:tetratricopeptide (TPR) repeat protein